MSEKLATVEIRPGQMSAYISVISEQDSDLRKSKARDLDRYEREMNLPSVFSIMDARRKWGSFLYEDGAGI